MPFLLPLYVRWNVDPALFQIGSREIRYYGLLWALALAIGLYIFYIIIVKKEKLGEKVLDSVFWYATICLIVGARLGHCLFYEPQYYLSHPLEMLYIWKGGLASHGAAIGLLIGLWLFSRKNRLPYIWSLDRIGIVVAIGGAAIRLGNLMNSEIYGIPTSLPWGFVFVRNGETVPMHPTQLYEALAYLAIFFILWYMYFKKDVARKMPGVMFGVFLILLFLSRFLIEFIKNPQEEFETTMSLYMGQWLSIPFILAGIVILIAALRKYRQRNPNPKLQRKHT